MADKPQDSQKRAGKHAPYTVTFGSILPGPSSVALASSFPQKQSPDPQDNQQTPSIDCTSAAHNPHGAQFFATSWSPNCVGIRGLAPVLSNTAVEVRAADTQEHDPALIDVLKAEPIETSMETREADATEHIDVLMLLHMPTKEQGVATGEPVTRVTSTATLVHRDSDTKSQLLIDGMLGHNLILSSCGHPRVGTVSASLPLGLLRLGGHHGHTQTRLTSEWAQFDNLCKVANTDYVSFQPFQRQRHRCRQLCRLPSLRSSGQHVRGQLDQQPIVRHRQPQPKGSEPIRHLRSRLQSRCRRSSLRTTPRSSLRHFRARRRLYDTSISHNSTCSIQLFHRHQQHHQDVVAEVFVSQGSS